MCGMHAPSDLAAPPPADTQPPGLLLEALANAGLSGAALRPVWRNGVGGLTFAVAPGGTGSSVAFYAKWNPIDSGESLSEEAARLEWLADRHPVPRMHSLDVYEHAEVLITHALHGESAVAEQWKADPNRTLRALGEGLRQLHAVPIVDCPFDWGVSHRMRLGGVAAASLGPAPAPDKLVLCQGDPCVPNTLLAADGSFLAHVDFARLGVADRWADLAVMTMSFAWNYRDYDESVFWHAYGIAPDLDRIAFYRKLWDAE